MFVMGVITGALFGGTVVLLLLCIVMAGDKADREMEYQNLKSEKVLPDTGKDQKQIPFVDIDNQELFWIEDGDCIELFSENGDRQTCLCHYLDRRHASIDGKRLELLTFARWMKKRGITYIPSTQQRRKGGVVA